MNKRKDTTVLFEQLRVLNLESKARDMPIILSAGYIDRLNVFKL